MLGYKVSNNSDVKATLFTVRPTHASLTCLLFIERNLYIRQQNNKQLYLRHFGGGSV